VDYCHPLVRQLKRYDEREGKDFLATLRAYILAGRSYTRAAELLGMHRNSVIYRMKQIEEILDFDFSKEKFVFHLELSFRILDYIRAEKEGKWEEYYES
jgi:DNA-binding PucR family transcriptional regulator